MEPQANPSMMLPSSLLRGGQTQPGMMFQQSPLATGMGPSAMASQPGLQPPPPADSSAINQSMPAPMQPGQPQAGQPDQMPGATQLPQPSEAEMLIKILGDRLQHHSKITQGTLGTLSKMIEAGLPIPEQNGQGTPPAA
jgi:hypothetical protein